MGIGFIRNEPYWLCWYHMHTVVSVGIHCIHDSIICVDGVVNDVMIIMCELYLFNLCNFLNTTP